MQVNFKEALDALGPGAAFVIANQARTPADYLLATILPERNDPDYHIESGNMTIRSTMAGLVGMDSPYPPAGIVEHSVFSEMTAKMAVEVRLPEAALRKLQAMVSRLLLNGSPTVEFVQREALNFLNKIILQPLFDTAEWLRAKALLTGAISWTYNKKTLSVSYGIPAANIFTNRSGTAHYGGSASVWWTDVRNAKKQLRHNLRACIMNSNTADLILYNDANKVEVVAQALNRYDIRRLVGDNDRPSQDARDALAIYTYDKEAEIYDLSNPGSTTKFPFIPDGKVLWIAENQRSGYVVGEGATPDPLKDNALGYTHIAPTVEGNGAPGRWADLSTPDNEPWQLRGRGVQNLLPVIEAPEKVVITSTDMS